MKLTLRIENFDFLPDGGPLEFSMSSRGCEVGRDSAMDWTLPDPTRHISSRHFEVVYRGGQFALNDLSTNGTFVHGQSMRVSSPLHLTHNDRLQVGQYIIRVMITHSAQAGAEQPASFSVPSAVAAADPWSLTPLPAPMPTPMPAPNRFSQPMVGQYGDSFVDAPRQPTAPPPVQTAPLAPAAIPPVMQSAAAARAPSEPFVQKPPSQTAPVPDAQKLSVSSGGSSAFLDAVCKGAGLPPGSLNGVDPENLGEEIGKCLRIATEELMALLGARAAAKQFVKSASRTMIGGVNNSPLKFKPNAIEAMLTMFAKAPDSYLGSTASFQQGFDDIKRHQTAVYAAMQPALAKLLEDLSPESIEGRAAGGIMSSKKARAWETFVERWDAKTHPYENGMLDVFLTYFADSYDVAVKKTGG